MPFLNEKPKKRIKDTGIKQKFIAYKIGIEESRFSNLLNQYSEAQEDELEKIAYILNFQSEEIIQAEQVPA
jgi:hypothetical protein